MIVAKVTVSGVLSSAVYRNPVTAGMVGAEVEFDFDSTWDGLNRTIVFRSSDTNMVVDNDGITKDVITNDKIVTIPPEVMIKAHNRLSVGVYGVNADGSLVIPTLWVGIGILRDGADPSGDPTTDPSLPVWAKLRAMIGDLDELDTTAKNNLVAAVNEAMTKGGGAASFETDNTLILEDGILRVNTTDVAEKDNTLPITSAGVDTIVGNIGSILDTI